MILILRGHIRNSFKTKDLYNLVENIYTIDTSLKIYINTWNIYANNISWRTMEVDDTPVTEEIIYEYFKNYKHCIEKIIIDDDTKIELIGNTTGNIYNGPGPIIGWKNYWYGKYKIINYIYNQELHANDIIINTRFDLFNNGPHFLLEDIIHFIKNNMNIHFNKNKFIFDYNNLGVDNIYMGNILTMKILIENFYYHLDDILIKHCNSIHQELMVYNMNNILFD